VRHRFWHLAAAVVLLALLAVVATLQYRWLGEVSAAERERLRASLRDRTTECVADVDRDITRAFAAFQMEGSAFESDPAAAIRAAAGRAARESATGRSVRALFLAQPGVSGDLRRFDEPTGRLVPVEWPAELAGVRRRLASAPLFGVRGVPIPPGFLGEAIDSEAPALIVPVTGPHPAPAVGGDRLIVRTVPPSDEWQAVVVWLESSSLERTVIAPIVARHFGQPDTSEYSVSVIARSDGRRIYDSSQGTVAPDTADLVMDLFRLRLDELHWTVPVPAARTDGAGGEMVVKDRVAITILRRGGGDGAEGLFRTVETSPPWRLLVRARRGSLDAVVERSRLRNVSVSLGVLALLGASLVLILLTSARQQRVARQQIEFVASVSHELRTPLAVIRSAGENLADGVVSGEQVARYGALIRNEGRRLSDMVERVMDFAGMTAGTLIRSRRQMVIADVVGAAAASVQADADERGVTLHVRQPHDPVAVYGDPEALTSALQNALGNAIKYSEAGSTVDVDVVASSRVLRVTVSDRGIGIDAADLPHVFKPFYRGRRAIDAQVRGSGVGLSLVQKIVEAHGGEVRIAGRESGGTVLTIELPLSAPPGTRP
jgi:signal transduction histidine kinase